MSFGFDLSICVWCGNGDPRLQRMEFQEGGSWNDGGDLGERKSGFVMLLYVSA